MAGQATGGNGAGTGGTGGGGVAGQAGEGGSGAGGGVVCSDGDHRCTIGYYEVCSGGEWKIQKTCTRGCVEGSGCITVRGVVAGGGHSCAVHSDANAFCWGNNDSGQLGAGAAFPAGAISPSPVRVSGLSGVADLAAGASHTCALLQTGDVRCWGKGTTGQLGDGLLASTDAPAAIVLTGASEIAAGGETTCAVKVGELWCWGYRLDGQSGPADGAANDTVPVKVSGLGVVQHVSVAAHHACVLEDEGAHCFGLGTSGQLGDGMTKSSTTPVGVFPAPVLGWGQIAAGPRTTLASSSGNYSLFGFGDATDGTYGNGVLAGGSSPVDVSGGFLAGDATLLRLGHGNEHSCAIVSYGGATRVRCAGRNTHGQLGRGDVGGAASPTAVEVPGLNVTAASVFLGPSTLGVGAEHTCVVANAGDSIFCWGNGSSGQVGPNTNADSGVPLEVSSVPN
jgi:alpha-tubulin suppressor-like RCC1 family protein